MPIIKPTLEEWFLMYQLRKLARIHFHLPFDCNADVSRLAERFAATGKKPPWTAVLAKAAALLAKRHPRVNRVVFHTFYGVRILEPDYIAVNIPVMIKPKGREHLSATMIRDPHLKTLDAIRDELKKAAARQVHETVMGPYVYEKPNTFFNRFRLRAIHFIVSNFPSLYQKFGAGGISVSSLLNTHDGKSDVRIQAYGQTGFTIGAASVIQSEGKTVIRLGVAYDHFAFFGEESARYANALCEILRCEDDETFAVLTS